MTNTKQMRVVSLVLAMVLALSMLAGCGASNKVHATLHVNGPEESVDVALECEEGDTLTQAMLEKKLVSEEEAEAGFFTEINGWASHYEEDGSWWSLTDAEGNMTSVGASEIVLKEGDEYSFTYMTGENS